VNVIFVADFERYIMKNSKKRAAQIKETDGLK
jgi:hypothetical protein